MLIDCVSPEDFPAWCFAEIKSGDGLRVVSIFHVKTPNGVVPYWYDDPENQHLGLPLLQSFEPVLLGDYGHFLSPPERMNMFIILCKAIDDLPDPLLGTQAIRWVENKGFANARNEDLRGHMLNAVDTIAMETRRRRVEFERVMGIIAGI